MVNSKSTHIARLGIDRLFILNAQSTMTVTSKPESRINRKRSVNQHTLSSPKDKVDELHMIYVNSKPTHIARLRGGQKMFSQPTYTKQP